MRTALVVGSGAGGAAAAKEMQGAFDVTILEAGREFRPLALSLSVPERLKRLGLLFDEREIRLIFPAMRVQKTSEGMVLVRGIGTGGTTTLATGNALRLDQDLRAIGVDLDAEFDELSREVPVSTAHQGRWSETTRRLFSICGELGLDPRPMPKMGRYESCRNCGRCVLGCPAGVKWDSRIFVRDALEKGARLHTGCRVRSVRLEAGRARGVEAEVGGRRRFYDADVIVLAAGGLGTPAILQDSGVPCEPSLFVDPVLCVAAKRPGALQNTELPMPFAVQRNGFILSPYFDFLSYYFNRQWRPAAHDIASLMIKLADTSGGSVRRNRVEKPLTEQDRQRLREAVDLCLEILRRLGIGREDVFFGTMNAGHPGGMLPLTGRESVSLHPERLPGNLYVADASLLPRSIGNPPILTIMALARRVARNVRTAFA